jgi:hypothetical protein
LDRGYSRFLRRAGTSTRKLPTRNANAAISSDPALPPVTGAASSAVAVFGCVGPAVVVPETVCEKPVVVADVVVPETVCEKLVVVEDVSVPVDVSLPVVVSLTEDVSLVVGDSVVVDVSVVVGDSVVVSLTDDVSLPVVVSLTEDVSLVVVGDSVVVVVSVVVSQSTQKTFILSCFSVSRSPSQKSL